MDLLHILNGVLLVLAVLQAIIGIVFFRPAPALWFFFFQVLVLTLSTFLMVGFVFEARYICAWVCIALFFYLALLSYKRWTK
ncbi:MAG: hypothetical protein ACYTG7_16090 [Planctomycetota bacterium]|jgi:hypothetical protein